MHSIKLEIWFKRNYMVDHFASGGLCLLILDSPSWLEGFLGGYLLSFWNLSLILKGLLLLHVHQVTQLAALFFSLFVTPCICSILIHVDSNPGIYVLWCFIKSGNLGNLLLIIVPAICTEDGSPFDKATCSSLGLSYASFSMAVSC